MTHISPIYYWCNYKLFDVKIVINNIELMRTGICVTYRHHCTRSLVGLRENEMGRAMKKTRGRESGDKSERAG